MPDGTNCHHIEHDTWNYGKSWLLIAKHWWRDMRKNRSCISWTCCTMLYHVAPCCTRCSVRCDKTTLRSILAGSRAGAAAHATVGRGQRTRTKQRRHPVQGRRSWDVIRGHETWISTHQSHQRERERVLMSSCICSTLRPETIRWLNRFLKKLLLPTLSSPLPDD